MADKIVKIYGDARFLPRHDTLENWQRKNPILLEAEPSYIIDGEDGKKIKFGDGVTPWNDLPYLSSNINNGGDITVDQTYNPDSENAQSGKAVAEAVAIEQKRSDNTFANALKSSKSGSAILIDDISPVTHEMSVKISSDTVTDLTAVKVTRCGKNLIPLPYSQLPIGTTTLNGIEFTVYEDGSILMNGTATTAFSRYLYNNKQDLLGLRAGDIITGSKWVSDNSQIANFNLTFNYYNIDGTMEQGVINLGSQQNLTTTITKDYVGWGIYIYISSGKTFDNLLFKPQLELGKTTTDYEPYVEPTEYTPNADGTVNGVTSLYPNITLMTDTDGVIIDCEYNKDINKFSGADVDVPTKTSELINDSNFATQDYVDEEIANFDFIKIVTELPETGLVNRTYFVPKQDPATNDLYDEYMWVDGKWELITTKQIEVDLTGYVKHTDINQSYDPTSENAQSGKAVKEAIMSRKDLSDMEDITTITMDADTLVYTFPSFSDYKILYLIVTKTYKATTGLSGTNWFRFGTGNAGIKAKLTMARTEYFLDASMPTGLIGQCFESNNLQQLNNNWISIGTQNTDLNKPFRGTPILTLANSDWAAYHAECGTVIHVKGVRR